VNPAAGMAGLGQQTGLDTASAIAALRARGAPRLDPVRLRHIEALARRAAAHHGPTRRLLDDKLARLLAACSAQVDAAQRAAAAPPARAPSGTALAELLAHVAHTSQAQQAPPVSPMPHTPGMVELKAIRNYRSTWARLKLDQRLNQLLAQVPGNAGPLHTQRLLHEALTAMRAASPQYLQHLMAQVDALLWLERAGGEGVGVATNRLKASVTRTTP
jgi:hypothetical protein